MPARTAKEQFDRQAEHYDSQWNSWSEETLRWMAENSDCRAEDRALDVATGTGFTALAFAPLVRSVIGLDVSTGMLAQAQKQAQERGITNVAFQEGVAEALPFAADTFDLVTCRIAPHHFLSVPAFLAETKRVLRPGGRMLLVDTSVPEEDPEVASWQNALEALRDPSHVRNYTPGEWRAFVEASGLTIERLDMRGSIPITLNDWIVKAGCTPEQAAAVRQRFATAPGGAIRAFQIQGLPNDDYHFVWQRVAIRARKAG